MGGCFGLRVKAVAAVADHSGHGAGFEDEVFASGAVFHEGADGSVEADTREGADVVAVGGHCAENFAQLSRGYGVMAAET